MLDLTLAKVDLKSIGPGVVCGNFFWSREELIERSLKITSALASLGIKKDDSIAIFMRNDLDFLTVSLAASALSAHAVPINWHFKAPEVDYIIKDCDPKVVITHSDLYNSVLSKINISAPLCYVKTPEHIRKAFEIDKDQIQCKGLVELETWINDFKPYSLELSAPRHSMIYTSGTTGRPKGVKREAFKDYQLSILREINREVLGITKFMRTVIPAPLYHSAPNIYALSAFRNKGLVVLPPRFDPEELLRIISEFSITHIQLVPSMIVKIVKIAQEALKNYDLSSLEHIVHAAAPIAPDVKRKFIEIVGPIVYEYYGSTETGAITWCDTHEWLKKPGTVGKPVKGCEVIIVGDNKEILGPYQQGEIFVKNSYYPNFTYHNDENKRKEIEFNGFITVGDVGYLDEDGYLFLCDRKKDMIISGGVNIYPAEIESVIISIPAIKDCGVFSLPDEYLGEKVAAVIEVDQNVDKDLLLSELTTKLKEEIANYKIPKIFLVAANLPRDDSGKLFKRKIREQILTQFKPEQLNAGIIWM
jgi:long-chain acyl-CoA synthetase